MEPVTGFLQQTVNGLVNGGFYAMLALGLAVIFGMLGVVNFAHGASYMVGAYGAYLLLRSAGLPYWWALLIVPVVMFAAGMALERLLIARLTRLDPLYNFLLTFGLTLVLQGAITWHFGPSAAPYEMPHGLQGAITVGSFVFPAYRLFVFGVAAVCCVAAWWALARTRVGVVVRAATEKSELTRALGINVGRWVTPVFGFGIALAGLAGVLAAPMQAVTPLMGADLIIVVFAVVVIGGLGSIFGSVAAGFGIGLVQALGEAYLSERMPILAQTLVFIVMAAVLLWRPAGLFGREETA
jgi:branched-chain amino acid transport system permease protein